MTAAGALTGTEKIEAVQAGATVYITPNQLQVFVGISVAKVSISSAEILALNTTPKTLIAAPGAGKVIKVLGVTLALNFGTAAYATNTNLRLAVGTWDPILTATSYLGATQDVLTSYPLPTINSDPSTVVNTPLIAYAQTGNPTAGDGTVDVYINYVIITM